MKPLPMRLYCPRSKYPLDVKEIIKMIVDIEAQWNEKYIRQPLPKYERKELKLTIASAVGLAGNMIKGCLP